MKRMRKYLALALAMGLMLSSMTVFAEDGSTGDGSTGNVTDEAPTGGASNQGSYSGGTVTVTDSYKQYEGSEPNSSDNVATGDFWWNPSTQTMKQWNGSAWVAVGCEDSSDSSSSKTREERLAIEEAKAKAAAEKAALIQAGREAVRMEAEAEAEGFENAAQMQYAQAENKSAGEYYNNAVAETQGIENATPVAQGGNLIIDGKVTNVTATISKVTVAFVDSVRVTQEGTVLNVVDVQFPATEATINFYMPGVTDGANIVALQYVDGTWVNVEVAEVRADHVVLNLKSNGIVAFVAK